MAGQSASTNAGTVSITVERAQGDALMRYRDFAEPRLTGAAQTPLWYDTWLEASGEPGHIVWLTEGGVPVAAVPLAETRRNGLAVLQFAGDRHANGNFCAATRSAIDLSVADLAAAVRSALPHVGMLVLERLAPERAGQRNLFAALASRESPNVALAVSLEDGFAGVLRRANSKRKSKKRRMQARRFEEAGGVEIRAPRSIEEVEDAFAEFLALKQARFAKAGIADVFAPPVIQSFWRTLFKRSLAGHAAQFTLELLVVGGAVRAVTGTSHLRDRCVCEFGAIAADELTATSPGEYLAYSNIEATAARGVGFYDFSVGDEAYKRSWCDTEIRQFDVLVPLSPLGRLSVIGSNLMVDAKRRVKGNRHLWTAAAALRRWRSVSGQPAD